jgi:3-dehydroquinate dehydratase / shikimate dehydrogenase
MKPATVVATIDRLISAAALAALPPEVDWLEVRADLCGDLDAQWLRQHFGGGLLYALHCADSREERILNAAREYDFVELAEGDLSGAVLDAIPPSRRVIAWHGPASTPGELAATLARLTSFEARFYRIVTRAEAAGEELAPLQLLNAAGRSDLVAYAEGAVGMWTRIASLQLGSPLVFGSVVDDVEHNAVPSVEQLITDYGLPVVREAKELFAIAGSPVYRSLSPRLHNAAFRALDRPALYVAFHVPHFDPFWQSIVASEALDALGLPLRAICVVSPHKEIGLAAAKSQTYFVQQAGSTNFIVRDGGDAWTADTTDPEGVMLTLRERGVEPANKRVAVVGCGGSGRAIASALSQSGADVTLVNRGADRGKLAVRLLHLPFVPLSQFSADDFSIVINATPLGRDGETLPFVVDPSRKDAVVVDLVYGSTPTPLVASARMAGQVTIDGVDVLLAQVRSQFRLMTGEEMPDGIANQLAGAPSRRATAAQSR